MPKSKRNKASHRKNHVRRNLHHAKQNQQQLNGKRKIQARTPPTSEGDVFTCEACGRKVDKRNSYLCVDQGCNKTASIMCRIKIQYVVLQKLRFRWWFVIISPFFIPFSDLAYQDQWIQWIFSSIHVKWFNFNKFWKISHLLCSHMTFISIYSVYSEISGVRHIRLPFFKIANFAFFKVCSPFLIACFNKVEVDQSWCLLTSSSILYIQIFSISILKQVMGETKSVRHIRLPSPTYFSNVYISRKQTVPKWCLAKQNAFD